MQYTKLEVRNSLVYGATDTLLSFNQYRAIIDASEKETKYDKKELERKICEFISKNTKAPLSIMFSGGVDSTFMLCMARKCFTDSTLKVVTCSFEEQGFDEYEKAKQLLKELKFTNQTYSVNINETHINNVIDAINKDNCNNLFFSSSLIPCYMGMQKAFKHGNSILTGDGGDELFGGYDRYLWFRFACRHPLIAKAIAKIKGGDSNPRSRKFRDFNDYKKQNTIWGVDEVDKVYDTKLDVNLMNSLSLSESRWLYLKNTNPIYDIDKEISYQDMMVYDIGTELFGCESFKPITAYKMARHNENQCLVSPFMDHEIQKYCVSLPIESKIKGTKRKIALRKSIYDYIPNYDKIAGKGKKGFGVPISKWMRKTTFNNSIVDSGLFTSEVSKYIAANYSGESDHGERLWACYFLAKLVEKGILEIVQ